MLTSGTRLGVYEIVDSIGAGGMGEVYRATDTKLGRSVAIKVLPDAFAADAERVPRFEREAKVLASLNHPHIAALYGMEEAAGRHFLIMELVEGEDLAARLRRGPLPIDEALAIARQVAQALDAAHAQGVVHRDLKPANIKVRPDGTVKVLDFGLAKAMDVSIGPAAAIGSVTNSPTITSPMMTGHGVILGTAAYMSPEQAKGRTVDARTDVWAFGCLVYEMLTGAPAFDGDDASEILAAILKNEPQWSRLPAETPVAVRRMLRRTLTKDRTRRLAAIADAALEIDEADSEVSGEPGVGTPAPRWRERVAWGLVAVLVAAAVAWRFGIRQPMATPPELRLDLSVPSAGLYVLTFAISPDGRQVAYASAANSGPMLWVRSLDSSSGRVVPGTEGAFRVFWSPDSRSIGFFARGRVYIVPVSGGAVQHVGTYLSPAGGTWHGDTILYGANNASGPIFRVSLGGGEPVAVTAPGGVGEVGHVDPRFLPDGRHFTFRSTEGDGRAVMLATLGDPRARKLLDADSAAVFARGHLVFVRQGTLLAQRFDVDSETLVGEPVALAADVLPSVSVSETGVIAYRGVSTRRRSQWTWHDRSGAAVSTVEGAEPGMSGPELSPDEQQLAVHMALGANLDLWIVDLERGVPSRFTSEPTIEARPVWSPDGARLAYVSRRVAPSGGPVRNDLYERPATGGAESLLLTSEQEKMPTDWSPDGGVLLYQTRDVRSRTHDLWALPMGRAGDPFSVVSGPHDERGGQFSPDGKWIAFESDESGRREVYVQPYPGPGRRRRVSTAGGMQVRWRPDGREIFYLATDGRLTAVPVLVSTVGTLQLGAPAPLFATSMRVDDAPTGRTEYVVSRAGRFLINTAVSTDEASPISLILNWSGFTR